MKKLITSIFLMVSLTSCGILFPFPEDKNYPTTTFIVKNNSDSTVHFEISVKKYIRRKYVSSEYHSATPYTLKPKDSVIARQIRYEKDTERPQKWFTKFTVTPVDGINFYDPDKAKNWKKWIYGEGYPIALQYESNKKRLFL